MTPDERNMLADLANKIAQTPAPPKDAEAEDFIRSRIGARPDALYLMTQTVLIQNMALQHAQEQIQQLQQQRPQPATATGGSFLGQQQPQYANPAPQYAPQYAPAGPGMPSAMPNPSGMGTFLRGAAQTAAGVAAGALAFEGISSLFSHPGYGGGFGGGFGGGSPVEETVVNNYYDSPAGEHHGERLADDVQYQDDSNVDDNAQYDDASYDSADDSGSDDNSGDSFA